MAELAVNVKPDNKRKILTFDAQALVDEIEDLLPDSGGGSGITQLTGDGTAGPGTGSQVFTLAATAVTPGTYGSATQVGSFDVDSKGRIIAASNVTITLYNQTIEDEGTPLTQRSTINFVGGGVTVTDVGGKTTVTIPSGGGGSVTSVDGASGASGFTLTGGPITTSGTLTFNVANATNARSTLGVAIGVNVQAWDPDLDAIAALTGTGVLRRTGTSTWALDTSTFLVSTDRTAVLVLCGGFTPVLAGADIMEVVVPYAADGTTSITWNVKRATFRVAGAGSANQDVRLEKSTVSGAFSASTITTLTLTAGTYEVSSTSSLGTLSSGDKVRFYVPTVSSATGWFVSLQLQAST